MDIYDKLRKESKGLVESGKEDQLIRLICLVVQQVGESIGIASETHGDIVITAIPEEAQVFASYLQGSLFFTAKVVDEIARQLGKNFE